MCAVIGWPPRGIRAASGPYNPPRRIDAPFAGVTGRRLVSPGAFLEAGRPITRLSQIHPLDLFFEVPGRQLGGLRPGLEVRATTPAYPDEVFTGELTFIGTEVDAGTRTLPLEVTLPNADARLRPGMFMEVTLVLGERETLTVPESVVINQGPSQLVYRLDGEEGGVVEREVTEPIEEAVSGIDGVRQIRSSSRDGRSRVEIEAILIPLTAEEGPASHVISLVAPRSEGQGPVNSGIVILRLKDWGERTKSQFQVHRELLPQLARITGAQTFAVNPPSLGCGASPSRSRWSSRRTTWIRPTPGRSRCWPRPHGFPDFPRCGWTISPVTPSCGSR